ncbi:hypothetical protein GCM10027570_19890 [Streptomonospora sediminis]
MVAIAPPYHRTRQPGADTAGTGRVHGRSGADRADRASRTGLRRLFAAVLPALQALFDAGAARSLVPEPDPAHVRALLIETGALDAAAPPQERRRALAEFQRANGLPDHGTADGRTVSVLARAGRQRRELRALGIV